MAITGKKDVEGEVGKEGGATPPGGGGRDGAVPEEWMPGGGTYRDLRAPIPPMEEPPMVNLGGVLPDVDDGNKNRPEGGGPTREEVLCVWLRGGVALGLPCKAWTDELGEMEGGT